MGFPDDSVGKESACNTGDTGDMGLIPGSERSPGEGNGNPLQYSCPENPMDRGAWQDHKELDVTKHAGTAVSVFVLTAPTRCTFRLFHLIYYHFRHCFQTLNIVINV